jgi:hypothetical protein
MFPTDRYVLLFFMMLAAAYVTDLVMKPVVFARLVLMRGIGADYY